MAIQERPKLRRPRPKRGVEYIWVKPTRFGNKINMPGEDVPATRLSSLRRLIKRNRIGLKKQCAWTKEMLRAFEARELRRKANPAGLRKDSDNSQERSDAQIKSGLSDDAWEALDDEMVEQLTKLAQES